MTLVLLLGIIFLTPLPFTACTPHSFWCRAAYMITSSGGPAGFFAALVITSMFYAVSAGSLKEKFIVFLKSAIVLTAFFGLLAFINERFTKPIIKSQRPSHTYMLDKTGFSPLIDSLYQLDKSARKQFFAQLLRNNPAAFERIDPEVQAHWIEESGYSFPSGHTFNAFLYAMILGYAISNNRSYPRLRKLYVLLRLVPVGRHAARSPGGTHSFRCAGRRVTGNLLRVGLFI